jgi:hypothetical protein
MNFSLQNEINERLGLYLIRQIDLSEFHDWLIPATWDIDAEEEGVKRLAHRILLLMAEFSNGDRTEDELRTALWGLRSSLSITVTVGTSPFSFGSTAINQRREIPGRSVGTGRAAAFAL